MLIGEKKVGCLPIVTGLLGILLFIMVILFILQTLFIRAIVVMAIDFSEVEVLTQTKDLKGVDPEEIKATFKRLRKALPRGKVNLGKARATASYALKARADDEWTADEVNTLLDMINAAIGAKKGEK